MYRMRCFIWGALILSVRSGSAGSMRLVSSSRSLTIPDEVTVKVKSRHVTVSGKRGTLEKDFRHLNCDLYKVKDEDSGTVKLRVDLWFGKGKSLAVLRTMITHVHNMIVGVNKGFRYKMRMVYAHFPINIAISDNYDAIDIRNFLGEKRNRHVDMLPGVTVYRDESTKDQLLLEGNDVELVSRSAALIKGITQPKPGLDKRKFLDGIFLAQVRLKPLCFSAQLLVLLTFILRVHSLVSWQRSTLAEDEE